MIQYELLRERGILILKPEGALRAEDFTALAGAVDPYIEQHGELAGLVVDAPSFPGWENFAALLSHLRFVRDHHRRIRRIAVVSDSTLLAAGAEDREPLRERRGAHLRRRRSRSSARLDRGRPPRRGAPARRLARRR